MSRTQSENGDDQFGCITHRGIQQSAKALAEMGCKIVRRFTENTRERNNSESGDSKNNQRRWLPDIAQYQRYRNKDQQPVQQEVFGLQWEPFPPRRRYGCMNALGQSRYSLRPLRYSRNGPPRSSRFN